MSLLQRRMIQAFPGGDVGLTIEVYVVFKGRRTHLPLHVWMLEDEHAIDECIDLLREIITAQQEALS